MRADGLTRTAIRLPVTAGGRHDYRQLFSAVFFDYFLFDDLAAPSAEVSGYLARLEIAHKVSIADGRSSTTDLSTGQRKRLVLIQVYLAARPVFVFDEWAGRIVEIAEANRPAGSLSLAQRQDL